MKLEIDQKRLEATSSYFKQWLKVLKMGIFSSAMWCDFIKM